MSAAVLSQIFKGIKDTEVTTYVWWQLQIYDVSSGAGNAFTVTNVVGQELGQQGI